MECTAAANLFWESLILVYHSMKNFVVVNTDSQIYFIYLNLLLNLLFISRNVFNLLSCWNGGLFLPDLVLKRTKRWEDCQSDVDNRLLLVVISKMINDFMFSAFHHHPDKSINMNNTRESKLLLHAFLPANIWMCHSRRSTGRTNNIKYSSVLF